VKAYIPKRLKDIIQKTAAYKVSLLCAPHGFGKSTLVLDYTKKLDANVIYLTLCYGGFESFCLLLCDAAFAENSEKADYYIKMAFKTPAVKKRFVHDVCKAAGGRETVFIIENYHLAMSKEANRLILDLSSEPFERIRFILISDKMCFKSDDINIMTKRVFMINSFNLSLTFDEIIGFCRFQGYCHTETHARKIMADTGGFIAPMKISGGSVSELPELMYRLLEPLYETISEDGKKLMLYLSPYSSFTEEAARFFLGRKSYRDVIDELCEKTALIAYDPASGNYKIHPALLTFCDKKILKIANSPAIFKKNGDWQVLNKNYKMAADFFIKARDYKSLMQAIEAGGFIFLDKSVLYKIYSETPKKTMIKYPYAILWLAAGFLAFGERNTFDEALRLFREGLLTCKDLKKEKMLAFCEFLLAFDPLAEFEDVKRHLVNAINFSCGKTIEEIKSLPAVLGAPTASEIFYKRGDFSDTAKSLCKLEGLFRSLGEGFRTGLGKCARAESMYMLRHAVHMFCKRLENSAW
jgi:ATP/maltotriose-dependent transcriptional regulator MalT